MATANDSTLSPTHVTMCIGDSELWRFSGLRLVIEPRPSRCAGDSGGFNSGLHVACTTCTITASREGIINAVRGIEAHLNAGMRGTIVVFADTTSTAQLALASLSSAAGSLASAASAATSAAAKALDHAAQAARAQEPRTLWAAAAALVIAVVAARALGLAPGSSRLPRPPAALEGVPVVGAVGAFREDPVGFLKRQHEKLGPVFSVNMLSTTMIMFVSPQSQTRLFRLSRNGDFRLEDAFYDMVRAVSKRTARNPAINEAIMKVAGLGLPRQSFVEMQRKLALPMVARRVAAAMAADGGSGTNDLVGFSSSLAIHISLLALIGRRFYDAHVDEYVPLLQQFESDIRDPLNAFFPTLPFAPQRRLESSMALFVKWVSEEIAIRKKSGEKHDDYLDHLLASEVAAANPGEVYAHIVNILLAAHTNTAGTIMWTLYELARDQALQDRVRQELVANGAIQPTIDDMVAKPPTAKPELLSACIKETGRRYQALFVFRKAMRNTEFEGYAVKRNEMIVIPMAALSLDDKLFPDPLKYDPSRFLEGRNADCAIRGEYAQFGLGVHKCLGEKFVLNIITNVVMPVVLSRATVKIVSPAPGVHPGCDYFATLGVPFPATPVKMQFAARG
ncbi:hypothetical protein HK105_207884 [Polyrhizophydium stewartii]|uniref:Cytochrome P450 n=1 Tax=Polyrhizophydium stewartii TaxID=2732419 RepID=A0ABR4MWC9_9FUNG